MTADRPTREGCSDPGSHPVMCRCLPPSIAAAVAARPAGQAIPASMRVAPGFDTEPDEPYRPSSPSSPVPEDVREEIARAVRAEAERAESIPCDMDCDPATCPSCSLPIQAAYLQGDRVLEVIASPESIADAVLATPAVRRLLDTAAAVERANEALDTLSRETGAYEAGYKGWAQQVIRDVRRALAGDQP